MEYLAGVLDWVSAHAAWAGPAVFLVAFLESLVLVGLIMPGALLMFGFGALVGSGHLDYWPIMLWATAGAITGDSLSYMLGRWFGPGVWSWAFFQHRPWLLQRSVDFFQRHGGKSIVLGRFVGPLRPVVPMVAGMMGMSAVRFLTINVLSAFVWAPAYLLPGQVLAASVSLAAAVAARLSVLFLAALALVWLAVVIIRWLARVLERRGIVRQRVFFSCAFVVLSGVFLFLGIQLWSSKTPVKTMSWSSWHAHPWEQLPLARQDFFGSRQAFSFQLAAHPVEIARALVQDGWQLPEPFDEKGALLWLSPEVDLVRVPPLPKRHDGRAPVMVFVRAYEGDRLVFRAWRSHVVLSANKRPVWLVTVERLRLTPGWPWLQQRELMVPAEVLDRLRIALERQLPAGSLCAAPPNHEIHQGCFN